MKTIALQRDLDYIKEALTQAGYNVIYDDEIKAPIDAYVYLGEGDNHLFPTITSKLSNSTVSATSDFNQINTILINIKGKSIQDITHIIESKLYSPLFY